MHFGLLAATFTSLLAGQGEVNPSAARALPSDATIIETVDISPIAGKTRLFALWMIRPKAHLSDNFDRNSDGGFCSDVITGNFGKYWTGPTRLSLVDSAKSKVVNTIEISDGKQDSFQIPLCVLRPAGRPSNNIDLQDLTGRGVRAEFALLAFEAYDAANTAVVGYDPKSDRVLQFPIEIHSGHTKRTAKWTEQVFARSPVRPGYWKFQWEPRILPNPVICSEEVRFDPGRMTFLQHQSCVLR